MKIVDFGALFRASPYPHLVMDRRLVILDVNDAFLDLANATKAGIIGKYVIDVLVENSGCIEVINYTEITDLLEKARENENAPRTTFVDEDHKRKPVFVIQQNDMDSVTPGLISSSPYSQELKNLQAAAQYKDEFLAHLSHELRNPVSSINAAAEILSIAKPDPARLQKMTDVIKRQINLLVGLIDDLSDISHFTKGLVGADVRLLDIKQVVDEAIEQNNAIICARNHIIKLEVSADEDFYIIGDHKRMLQVLKNLLSNAAKYTPQGGNIWVKLGLDKDQVTINVVDDGNGIPAEILPKIFELFGPASQSLDHLNHGLGIGLAVVKNIVERHSGSVAAYSNEGVKGSRFEIRLPAAAAKAK